MRTFGKIILLVLICVFIFGLAFLQGASKIAANFYQQQADALDANNTTPEIVQPVNLDIQQPTTPASVPAPTQQENVATNQSSCLTPDDPSEKDLRFEPVGPNDSIGNYVPADLVLLNNYVPTTTGTICLTKDAAVALQSMFSAMHAEKLYPLVTSGFRDVDYQEYLYHGTNVVTNGYSSVALPGHSEHQLGMAVDFIGIPDKTNTDYSALNDFGQTLDYAWLVQNAATYGFVQSYQAGKEPITGYIAEPWHWRYVGVANAQAIVASGLAPVQFLENLTK